MPGVGTEEAIHLVGCLYRLVVKISEAVVAFECPNNIQIS